jgi:hypothetical protein
MNRHRGTSLWTRRDILTALTGSLACLLLPALPAAANGTPAAPVPEPAVAPGIPIAMFHKVDDAPRYPEDISPEQLARLLDHAFEAGFRPVNISDIVEGRADRVVPKGKKPLGITVDDSHRSVLFDSRQIKHPDQRNSRSFYDVYTEWAKRRKIEPRATFFLTENSNDRLEGSLQGYFGDTKRLRECAKKLAETPGTELGYHTRLHKRLSKTSCAEFEILLQYQEEQFRSLGAASLVRKIFSYPYGLAPEAGCDEVLKRLGFSAAVLASPGVGEGATGKAPFCLYDRGLKDRPYHMPRINVGAGTYSREFVIRPEDPVRKFDKDIGSRKGAYVSAGA